MNQFTVYSVIAENSSDQKWSLENEEILLKWHREKKNINLLQNTANHATHGTSLFYKLSTSEFLI